MHHYQIGKWVAALLVVAIIVGAALAVGIDFAYADTTTGTPPVESTPSPDSIKSADEVGGLNLDFAFLMIAIEALLFTV